MPNCHKCERALAVNETAWADEWKVLDVKGERAVWRTETRYTCEDCEAAS